jgi:hypothetical protein
MGGLNRNTGSAGPARRLPREAIQIQPETAYGTVTLTEVVPLNRVFVSKAAAVIV